MGLLDPVTNTLGLLSTMARAGIIAPMRPDKYLRIAGAMQRENMAITSGFAAADTLIELGARVGDEVASLDVEGVRASGEGAAYKGQPNRWVELAADLPHERVAALVAEACEL